MLCSASACWCIRFGERRRVQGDAALSCACEGQGLMLAEELQHPLRCHDPEWLLPSLWGKGTWATVSLAPDAASAKLAAGTALSHSHGARDQGPAVGLLGWSWGSWQPLTSHHQQQVPKTCWFPPGKTY